ncbi:MAG: phosphatase PAP2 family protein [Lachnospiraceae bacterium]|nr:phosphatase PAP2 family protein [Lachnospiraceae bacterium]
MEWEANLIEWAQAHIGGLGSYVELLAFLGAETGLLMIVLIVMFCWKKEVGQKLALIVACVNMWLPMIKSVVLRPRPFMKYPDRVKPLVVDAEGAAKDVAAQGYSFPSMHSASIPAVYFPLAYEAKKKWLWILAAVLTVLVGISRPIAGMHYPTDVLAGWILGFAVIGIFAFLDRYIQNEWLYYLILFVSGLPGFFFVRTNDYFTAMGCLIGAVAAIYFERKYVNFQETKKISAMILRVIGAVIVYFVANTLLKLPFDKQFLAGASFGALFVRMIRYTIVIFLIMGVYPMIFPLYERGGKKQ